MATQVEQAQPRAPRPANWWKWFDPRGRGIEGYAFILNRITALGLTLYLFMHLIILGTLARGPEAYGGFLALMHNPIIIFGEWLVVFAGLLHGLNGLRIALTSFGIAVRYQRIMLVTIAVISLVTGIIFAVRMFTA